MNLSKDVTNGLALLTQATDVTLLLFIATLFLSSHPLVTCSYEQLSM